MLLLSTSSLTQIPKSYAADDSITLVQVQAILATDNDGNNIANIGDIVQVQVVLNNTDGGCAAASTVVMANMQAYGGTTNQNMTCVTDNGGAGDVFDLGFPVVDAAVNGIDVAANNAASQITVVASDADENNGAGNPNPNQNTNPLGDGGIDTTATNGVDTIALGITDGNISASISTDNNTPGVADINDVISITWDNSGGGDNNGDVNPANVFANLGAFGGSTTQLLYDDASNGDATGGDDIYSFDLTISSGSINGTNLNALISAQDDAQNSTGAVSDSSNLSVNNLSSGGRRRQPTQSEEENSDEESTSPLEIASCGCDEKKQALDKVTFDLYDQYSQNADTLMCLNPGCFDSPVVVPSNATEEALITANQERKAASKKYREERDKETKANTLKEDKGVNAGEANLKFAQITLEGPKAGESQQDYDARRKEAALELQRAFSELHVAEREALQAEEKRRDAQRDFDKAKKKFDDAYEAAIEEFGLEKAHEMYEKAEKNAEFGPRCIDPGCDTGDPNILPFQLDWEEAQFEYKSCLNQCNVSDTTETFLSPTYTPLSQEQKELIGTVTSEVPDQDFGPFESLSGFETFLPSTSFATDISGHPSESFITDLYQAGIVKGVGDTKNFAPNDKLTRAAMLKIAMEVFGYEIPSRVSQKPFADVDLSEWHARYFDEAAKQKILLGYGDQDLPQVQRQAVPWQFVNRVEALAILVRAGNIDISSAEDYSSEYIDEANPEWWAGIWKWAEMNGVVNTDELSFLEAEEAATATNEISEKAEEKKPSYIVIYPKDEPEDEIKRWDMSEMAIKIHAIKKKEPCHCDKEKAALETAKKEQIEKDQAATDAETAAQDAEKEAKKAEDKAKASQDAVDDLGKYDDDSSSATGEDNEKITTGDLRLIELAKAEIDAQVNNGDKSLEDGQKEKEGINKDILPELRARRDALLDLARKQRDADDKDAKEKRSKADGERTAANNAKTAAEEAAKNVEEAQKAYDECLKKCKLLKEKVAKKQKQLEEARRKRAMADAKKRHQERKAAEAKAKADAKAEADRQAREDAAEKARRDAEKAQEAQESGPIPNASKDPCKEKFLLAVAARGAQIAKTRPDDIPEPPAVLEDVGNFTTAMGELIAAAAQTASAGGSTALQIANALAALPQVAYGYWAEYVGDVIKDAGTRIINNRRICNYVKYSTTGVCGYEAFPPGQVVYWEKDASGKYQATIMGPGDNVTRGQCE